MGAPDLLRHLRGAGFTLAVAEGGGIRIAPISKLSDDHRQAIRVHKAELLALLSGEVDDAEHEAFEERAAVIQFDAGLSRADAETEARACVACEFQSRRKTCLEPVLAGLAPHFSIRWCDESPGGGSGCPAYQPRAVSCLT